MRKKAWLFLGCLIVFSAAGMLLRALELRTALDTSTMLMDSVPASWQPGPIFSLAWTILYHHGLYSLSFQLYSVP